MTIQIGQTDDLQHVAAGLDVAEERDVKFGNENNYTGEYKGIYNTSKDELSQIATKKYSIIQHRDVVNGVHAAIDRLGLEVNGKITDNGDRIEGWLHFTNDDEYRIVEPGSTGDEDIKLGIQFQNSYDGSCSMMLQGFGYRSICSNGMILGKKMLGKYHRRHVGDENTAERIQEIAKDVMDDIARRSDRVQAMIEGAHEDVLEKTEIYELLDERFSAQKHIENILENLDITLITTKEENEQGEEEEEINLIKEEDASENITKWEVYNAITAYATHSDEITQNTAENIHNESQKVLLQEEN